MKMSRRLKVIYVILMVLAGNSPMLFSQTTYTWGGVAGDWSDAGKWSPNGVPGSNDTAVINISQVNVNSNATVKNVILNGGTISGSAQLKVTGAMTWTLGAMSGSGTTRIDAGATLLVNNTGFSVDLNVRTLENYGTVTWTGTKDIKLRNSAHIYNRSGATFDVQTDGRMDYVLVDNGGYFTNQGTLKKTAGVNRIEIDPIFRNDGGEVHAYSGTLRFERGDTLLASDGDFYAHGSAVLELSERLFILDDVHFRGDGVSRMFDRATLEVTGAGMFVESGATFALNTDHLAADGFLQGDGPIRVDGIFDWKRGAISGSDTLKVFGSLLTTAGGTRQLMGKAIVNHNEFLFEETIRVSAGGYIENRLGALIDFLGDDNIITETGGGNLANFGTVVKSGGVGTSEIKTGFFNYGLVDIQTGTVRFSGSITTGSASEIRGSGILRVSGISFTSNGLVNPGSSPGRLTVTGNYAQSASGSLNIEIGGLTAGVESDQLQISGSATLNGTLNVSLVDGYLPVQGQVFEVVTCSTRSGSFSTVNLPQLNGQPVFSITYQSNKVLLTALQGSGLLARVKVWLQGPYATGSMLTTLNGAGGLPLNQPYNTSPWNYNGSEEVLSMPSGTVDWVLLQLRSSLDPTVVVDTRAALLLSNGNITDLNGNNPVFFDQPQGNYYLAVYHRNHLAVMSATPVALSGSSSLYDFTTAQSKAYGTNPMVLLETGIYGLAAGDGNGVGGVNASDKDLVWRSQDGTAWQYSKGSDYNLDGSIDVFDLNFFWRPNIGKGTQVP